MRHTLLLTAVLFAFWVLLSGYFTPFLLGSGLVCAYLVARVAVRMEVADREGQPFHLGLAALAYWPWLAKEIAKAAWGVTRIIVHPRLPLSPALVRFKPLQQSSVGLVTHANSITLTPGTITVEALGMLAAEVRGLYSDANWLRARFAANGSLAHTVRESAARWAGDKPPASG